MFYSLDMFPNARKQPIAQPTLVKQKGAALEFNPTIAYDRDNPNGADFSLSSSILKRIASGDSEAVQACLDEYGGLVWSLAKRFIHDQQEAEDAVQEIFIELWKKAHLFNENLSNEKTFIAMLTRRRLIDRVRRTYRRPNMESLEVTVDTESAPSVDAVAYLDGKRALAAFSDLKPEQQKCLRLSLLAGMSHSEIAEVVALPIGTVKSHIRRGMIAVRNKVFGENPILAKRRST